MIATFDPDKDELNRIKHGVPLLFGMRVFQDPRRVILASHRPVDGEDRFKVVGLVEDRWWTAIYVERGNALRLISVRRSNDGEQRNYDRHSRRSQ